MKEGPVQNVVDYKKVSGGKQMLLLGLSVVFFYVVIERVKYDLNHELLLFLFLYIPLAISLLRNFFLIKRNILFDQSLPDVVLASLFTGSAIAYGVNYIFSKF